MSVSNQVPWGWSNNAAGVSQNWLVVLCNQLSSVLLLIYVTISVSQAPFQCYEDPVGDFTCITKYTGSHGLGRKQDKKSNRQPLLVRWLLLTQWMLQPDSQMAQLPDNTCPLPASLKHKGNCHCLPRNAIRMLKFTQNFQTFAGSTLDESRLVTWVIQEHNKEGRSTQQPFT